MQVQSKDQTVTESFSFSPAKAFASLVVAVFLFSSCQNLQTREDIRREQEASQTPQPHSTTQPPPGSIPPPVAATPPPAPTPVPAPNTFLTKEPPKVGVILGPGGLKSFAHIGVLKEMSRARLPIRAVVGLEWGAIIGGLYAMQGQVNEVEWKAFKLREEDIPSGGLLSKQIQAEKPSELSEFFNTVFAKEKIERSKIEFACPTYNMKTEKIGWWNRGDYRDGMKSCASYPPYYVDTDGWTGAPFAIEEAAAYLRSKGANLIIFVNVLGGEIFNSSLIAENYPAYVLWSEAKRQASRKALPGVNLTITVNTADGGMTDFGNRRQMMDAGAQSARDVVNKLVTQYGY